MAPFANGPGLSRPGQDPPSASSSSVEHLTDDLMMQRAILASLRDLPPDSSDIRRKIIEAETEIECLEGRLADAQQQHSGLLHPASSTGEGADITGSGRSRFAEGSSSFSGASTPSGTPSRAPSRTHSSMSRIGVNPVVAPPNLSAAQPRRKRSLGSSHLEAIHPALPGSKSRRTTPSPADTAITSPSIGFGDDFCDDPEIIDLTGEDDGPTRPRHQQAEARTGRIRMPAGRDAGVAPRLQGRGYAPRVSSPLGWSHLDAGVSDSNIPPQTHARRHLGNANFTATGAASSSRQPAQPIKPEHLGFNERYKVPGAWDDGESEEDDGSLSALNMWHTQEATVRPRQMPFSHGSPSVNHMLGIPASEVARRAALRRQQGWQPSPPRGFGSPDTEAFIYRPQSPAFSGAAFHSMQTPPRPSFTSRPGYVENGMAGVWSNEPYDIDPGPWATSSQPKRDHISDVIARTSSYDWGQMTDADGNPFDSRLANYIEDVFEDPRKTDEEIQELLSNVNAGMDIPEEERGQTPDALRYALYPHQQIALKWMASMEEGSNKGGILADDMGLGKTISTIALMVTRKATDNVKTNLIVGPVALIKQWEREIAKKVKREHRLSVCLLHGKKLAYPELKKYDVVLTTYGLLAQEWKKYNDHLQARQDASGYDAGNDLELHRKCPILHPHSKFYRVILDEAQCIKNKDAQSSKGASQITATYRWCLTGTPMMNSVAELFPLIRFLNIRPYNDFKMFQKTFSHLTGKRSRSSQQGRNKAMQQLRIVLKAIMLRRMKGSMVEGKPILTLPPKTESAEHVVFSPDELSFYRDLESKSQVQFNKYLRQGTVGKNYSNILVLLLRLRQACCHPHLNMDVEYISGDASSIVDMVELAKTLKPAVVERIRAIEAFECPICYDAVEDPTLLIPCGHDTCSECFTSLTENTVQENIRLGQESGAGKCPQCRGPINSAEVISYTAFKKAFALDPEEDDAEPAGSGDDSGWSDDGSETASEADDDDAGDDEDDKDAAQHSSLLDGPAVPDDVGEPSVGNGRGQAEEDDDAEFPDVTAVSHKKGPARAGRGKGSRKERMTRKKSKGKAKLEEVKPHMLKTLRIEAAKNQEARRRYMHYLKENWQPSAKVTRLAQLLKEIEPTGEKTIVFSQWTALLDLLEIPIKNELGIRYSRYDGGMSRTQRDEAARDFVENPRTKVLLVSLRAGNAGLNLTAASHIIICDPFWNPYIEMQAVDRAHRIGQQRPVMVHRVLTRDTVEDRIVQLQEQKRALVDAALDEGESKSLGRLSVQELRYLFHGHSD